MYTERQEYTLMGVSTTVGCRKLTSHWSPMCGGQKLQTYMMTYPFGKDRAHPVGPDSHDYFVVIVE